MSGLALLLIVGGAVVIRGALKGLSPLDAVRDIFDRSLGGSGYVSPRQPGGNDAGFSPDVERWRPLVSAHFPAGAVEEALSVMDCESGGNPGAVNPLSGASGLFQHMPAFWSDRATKAGVPGASPFDPAANIQVAGWLYKQSYTWSHWSCKPSV